MVHRQQLDRGDPEVDEVLDHRRVGQPGVGAAQVLGDRRMQPGEALDVQLVEHRLGHRRGRRRIGVGGGLSRDDDAQRHGGEGVGGVGHVVGLGGVVQDRTGVVDAAGDRAGVRVEQQLGRVEPGAAAGIPLAVDAVAVALAGADAGDEHRPDPVGRRVHVVVGLAAVLADQGELDPGRAGRPQSEHVPPSRTWAPSSDVSRGAGGAGGVAVMAMSPR